MTPNYLNPSQTSSFLAGSSTIEDHDQQFHHQFFGPSYHHQPDASSSSHSFHFYFTPAQDQAGFNYHTELVNQPQQQQFDQGNGSVVACGGSYNSYQVENRLAGKGLKISLGINEGKHKVVGNQEADNDVKSNSAKWMSSKMKMMHKMKKSDNRKGGDKEDFQKLPFKNNNNNPVESNGHGSICSSYNSNNPIRVCADCNTTKTPLWRSGPKGPKSLCNACGIRQRKARRALAAAAAAAAANGTPLSSTETTQTPSPSPSPPPTNTTVKIKVTNQKADKSKNNYSINGLSTVPFKKRCRVTTTNASLAVESSSAQEPAQAKKLGFEDFLINLNSKLPFHNVFPQDEKEAAILLMALSCGLVHG